MTYCVCSLCSLTAVVMIEGVTCAGNPKKCLTFIVVFSKVLEFW